MTLKKICTVSFLLTVLTFTIFCEPQIYFSTGSFAYREEGVKIIYVDLDANQKNWISLVPAGAKDDYYSDNFWKYTDWTTGDVTFYPEERGIYEARLYLDWPDGGYTVADRCRITVVSYDNLYVREEYISDVRRNEPHPWYPGPISVNGTAYYGFQRDLNNEPIMVDNSQGNIISLYSPQTTKSEAHGFIVIKGHANIQFDDYFNVLSFTVQSMNETDVYQNTFDTHILFEDGEFEILAFLNNGPGEYWVEIKANSLQNWLGGEEIVLAQFTVVNTANNTLQNQNYLYHTADCPSQDWQIRRQSKEAAGHVYSDRDKAKAIFDYLTDYLDYDSMLIETDVVRLSGGVNINTKRKGICAEQARLTAAYMRAQGLPARVIDGFMSDGLAHGWTLVYWDGSWHHIDTTSYMFDFSLSETGRTIDFYRDKE